MTENSVTINGVKWATCNVDKPGTFAATPESFGMYYQWGRNIAWSENDPLTSSDGTRWNKIAYKYKLWRPKNDPSPVGWRLPTLEEFESLFDEAKVISEWTTQNGVTGRKFTDKATGASIFLPAAGCRNREDGSLNSPGTRGFYWSSTAYNTELAYDMFFNSEKNFESYPFKIYATPLRCVAD